MIDFILKYAESIKKEKLTSFHLLYAYACFCLMPVKEICEELELGKEAYGRISYLQGKINDFFDADNVKIDPVKMKFMIQQQVEYLESDPYAIEDYKTAEKFLNEFRDSDSFQQETIVYTLLLNMIKNEKKYNVFGMNNTYLVRNKSFMLEKKREIREKETLESIAGMYGKLYDVLTEKIMGQDMAIQKFVRGYINAGMTGKTQKGKPAASYLFAGPPGVGKTYLASLFAKTLNLPFKILDMSEYADIHSSNGLVGFERTWRNSQPGVLTPFVMENPKSILLVDEIEKADNSVKMLFLQVLEGARLYDKYYEKEVNFENVIIIFTTNCGKSLYQENEGVNLSTLAESEVLEALREDGAFPNELCSRFASGNIIMFNHLEKHHLCGIVRDKLEESTKDIKENHNLQLTYDKWLPELFLFQMGGNVDARIVSGRGAEVLKDCVVSFVSDTVAKYGKLIVNEVAVEIELKKENEDIYSLFVREHNCNILIVSDNPKMRFQNLGMQIFFATDERQALQVIREQKIMFIIIDLNYQVSPEFTSASNALGVDSVGNDCLNVIRKKAPQIPVYVVNQEFYQTEDKKEILNIGVRGIFEEGTDEKTCAANMEKLAQQLHIENNLKLLTQKGQSVEYQTRYFIRENTGIVEFYNLRLREIGRDDAALRRKAKNSKVFDFERPKMRFSDIIGAEQAKRDMGHFINYMHNIDKYVMEGAQIPKGLLLYGPPGTGKTSLVKAFAGECEALFLNTTGAGIRNSVNPVQEIKDLFKIAYANAPAILFIDEIDVIAKERTGHDTGLEMLVNTLLTEMEGFYDKDPFKPVFVVAATNYNVERRSGNPYEVVIDPALVRRFDNSVYVGLPSREERKKYLYLLLEQKNYKDKISEAAVDYAAENTGGKSLAFLKRAISNMTNAAIDMQMEISDDLLTDILETQLYGEKRENNEDYRLSVARHEAGHAYIGFKTGREPKFITIVSRGNFGGYVSYGDGEDVYNMTKDDFLNHICQMLAGRAAEKVYYGESGINTGAGSDLEKATKCAVNMICRYGMGSMGLVSLNPEKILESSKGEQVLEEAEKILEEQMLRAMKLIKEGKEAMDKVVSVLMDKSYIQGENLIAILEEGEQAARLSAVSVAKPHKWYVVINGRKPGIYITWNECCEQVKGYRNAVYRSFESEEAAKEAFHSARIGTKNIKDKKLLYYLVKLQDLEKVLKEGLCLNMQIGEKKYIGFEFHAYAPSAVKEQREHSDDTYVYLCVTRENAMAQGYQIVVQETTQESPKIYEYKEGFAKIDWAAMEEAKEKEQANIVCCVAEKKVSLTDISCIYVPEEEIAVWVKQLCRENGEQKENDTAVIVNKRMFI